MRGAVVALLLPLLAAPATAQQRAADVADRAASAASPAARPFGGAGQQRMPRTLNEPLGLMPPNASVLRSEPAPIPNRDIEPPRSRDGPMPAATLEPMLLPTERNQGMTFGREHLRDSGPDRPFDAFVPGARLRIPFESSPPGR